MNNSSEDSHTAHVANAQIGADGLLPTIQEDEEVICDPGNKYTLPLLIDALHRYTPRRAKIL